jgi:hypothetical protein
VLILTTRNRIAVTIVERGMTRRLTVLALGIGLLAAGCSSHRTSSIPHSFAPGTYRLIAFDSCDDALNGLRSAASQMVGTYGFGGGYAVDERGLPVPSAAQPPQAAGAQPQPMTDNGAAKAAPNAAGGAQGAPGSADEPEFSGTNSHETNADEPDLVKTDGHRIVTVTGTTLRVVDAAGRRLTGLIDLATAGVSGSSPGELLLFGDHALVLMHQPVMYAMPATGAAKGANVDLAPVSGSELVLVNLPGPPTVLSTVHVSADLLDARQTGSTARVVLRSSPHIAMPPYQPNQTNDQRIGARKAAVEQAGLDAWLPRIEVTTGSTTKQVSVACDDISRPESYSATSILTVLSFDLGADALGDGRPVVLAADGNTVYGTGPTLYVASDQRWKPVPATPGGGAAKAVPAAHTEIYKFDTSGERPVFVAGGTVAGYLLNQYALSEWNGSLRVATTSVGQPSATTRATTQAGVYVLAQDGEHLSVKGSVEGLGKGEQIYAVRFVGPVGYVVTFRQTDPLYTVDLADPAHPTVAGQLKIPGYSAYLHPAEGSKLIGVGQNANAQGRISGTQVSLFDVGDLASPSRLASYTLAGSHSDAEFDPHAFLYWPATGLLVIPLQSYTPATPVPGPVPTNDIGGAVKPGSTSLKLAPQFGALVLKVSGSTIAEVGFITHPSDGSSGYYYPPQILRSLIVDKTLWTVSAGGLLASDMTTLVRQAWVPFN